MIHNQTKDLFQLQIELVDMKVDMAVSRTIDRVIEQITHLRNEMHTQIHSLRNEMHEEIHGLRHEMRDRFVSLENRVTAVETKLGMVSESRRGIRNRLIDYCFRAGWLVLAAIVSYFALQLHLVS
jgi:hypothetical protein